MRQALLACMLIGAITAPALADGNTGLIYGHVYIDGTEKAPCPTVVIATSDRQGPQRAVTGADGTFHFFTVMPGRVTLTVGSVARDVIVSANITNMDTYVRPFYVPRQRATFIVRSKQHFISHSAC
jgi:hypothetical protein